MDKENRHVFLADWIMGASVPSKRILAISILTLLSPVAGANSETKDVVSYKGLDTFGQA